MSSELLDKPGIERERLIQAFLMPVTITVAARRALRRLGTRGPINGCRAVAGVR